MTPFFLMRKWSREIKRPYHHLRASKWTEPVFMSRQFNTQAQVLTCLWTRLPRVFVVWQNLQVADHG